LASAKKGSTIPISLTRSFKMKERKKSEPATAKEKEDIFAELMYKFFPDYSRQFLSWGRKKKEEKDSVWAQLVNRKGKPPSYLSILLRIGCRPDRQTRERKKRKKKEGWVIDKERKKVKRADVRNMLAFLFFVYCDEREGKKKKKGREETAIRVWGV